jgi:hypothetical protein
VNILTNCFGDKGYCPELWVYPCHVQWFFLQGIQRASVRLLDLLYEQILKTMDLQKELRTQPTPETGKIKIELGQTKTTTKSVLPLPLFNFLKDGLNFASREYIIKKKLGKSIENDFADERNNCLKTRK